MHVPHCYHRVRTYTLYYNDRHVFLFLSLSLSIIRNVPQIQQPDTANEFGNIKTSITPFGATNGASEIVGLARVKLRRGTSN